MNELMHETGCTATGKRNPRWCLFLSSAQFGSVRRARDDSFPYHDRAAGGPLREGDGLAGGLG